MKYSSETLQYMKNQKFDTRYDLKLEPNEIVWRCEKIEELCNRKRVIHIGCCDHIDVIDEKISKHMWLHGLLDECCEDLLGIDIDTQAVDYCNKNHYSKNNLICEDIMSKEFFIDNANHYDYILLPEMLEHVNNPVEFLTDVKINMEKIGFKGKYIITVPNALAFLRRKPFLEGYERINTDHRYWFTPYTIGKIMVESGIIPNELFFVSYAPINNSKGQLTYTSDSILIVGD